MFGRPFKPEDISEPAAKTIAGITELLSILPFGNKKPALTIFSVGYMAKYMTMSIEKAKQKLNYVPEISNQEGFEKVREWYIQTKHSP
jgi:sterol-4alpha-carboxylate 3-dehydrogenase (decarboxylating)